MSEPHTPAPSPPENPLRQPQNVPGEEISHPAPREQSLAERMFAASSGLATGGRLFVYLVCAFCTAYSIMWLGASFFSNRGGGVARLWGEMYEEFAMLSGAVLPAFLMARLEGRMVDVYGLPRRQAFGKMFWVGAAWGLTSITVLMVSLRGAHAFYFGQVVLHGARALRFALFWAVFFVLVGLFEEFLLRGYILYTLAGGIGFWPAALLLSLVFGAVHFRNPGETWVGLLGVVAIGIFFCLTLYRTGNLWFAVGFHAFWDWGQTYLYSVPDSGTMETGHLIQPSFRGPDWLTGGSVGPEASVLCFALIAGLCGVFARRYREVNYAANSALHGDFRTSPL